MTAIFSRKPGYLFAGLLVVVLGFLLYEKYVATPSSDADQAEFAPATEAPPATTPSGVAASVELSLAVLPFANARSDSEQQFLPDGLSRELLELLAEIPQLEVASRSSAFQFRGQEIDLSEVTQALGVAHVLTGSVQKTDDTLQLTTRLIRSADGDLLWSANYDRPLEDIFAIQDDIVTNVASALSIGLAGNAPSAEVVDPNAYLLFLQARYHYDLWTEEGFERAVDAHQEALRIDPDYVEGWAGLAITYLTQTQNGYREAAYGIALARNAIDKALEIDPNRASVLARLAHIQLMMEWDWAGAEETLARALRVAPRDTRVLGAAAYLANCFGRSDEALDYLERGLAEDPDNLVTTFNIAEVLHRAGRLNEAAEHYRRVLELNPKDPGTHTRLAIILLQQGEPDAAWRELELESEPHQQEYGRLLAMPALGRADEVSERLQRFIERNQSWAAYYIANIYAWHGDRDNAFLWLNHAYEQRASSITQVLLEPTLGGLHDDPRWGELLKKLELPLRVPQETV